MKRKIYVDLIAPLGMVGITILSGALLMSVKVKADDSVVDNVSVTVPASCTMSGTGMNSHTAEIPNGTYQANIGTTTLHAFCNDANGFAIYAAGYTGNEIGGTNSNKLVGTAATNNATIVTGLATSTPTPDISNWAMKLAIQSDSGNTTGTNAVTIDSDTEGSFANYHTVPNEYKKVAHKNTATDMTASTGGVKLTTTYAAYISKTQPADTYTGQVIYTLVHPASEVPLQPQTTEAGCIRYYPNGSNVEGSMGCQTISTSATSATLLASNFSRQGYGFAGWSTTYDYSDPTGFLGPQEDITFTAGQYTGSNSGLSLYAHWIKSAGSLQDWSGCSSLASGAVTALTDQRDGETYAIAKLADGKCWMIENLRLESTNSDNSTGNLAQGYGGQFAGLADAEPAWANNSTTANSLYYSGTQDGTASIDIGTSNASYRSPRYNNINTSSRASSPTTKNTAMYSYGNYYTWSAAIADTTDYTTNNQSVENTSICPAGWRLPKGGDKSNEANNEFWSLVVTGINNGTNPANYESSTTPHYNNTPEGTDASNKLRAYPNNFVYSGLVSSGTVNGRGGNGRYWSSTANSSGRTYCLYLDSYSVYPGTDNNLKDNGRTVRCVALSV